MKECIIVGAGIAGLSAAWYLQERGVDVTVLDSGVAGQAASWGNAGQVNPAFTVPLPAPGQVRYALRSVVGRRGSLLIPLTLDPAWWKFVLQFSRNCTTRRWQRAMTILTHLTELSLEEYRRLGADGIIPRMRHERPLLVACTSEREAQDVIEELESVDHYHQVRYEITGGDELREVAPYLSHQLQRGLKVHDQNYLDPRAVTGSLCEAIRQRGGELSENTPVREVVEVGNRVQVRTTAGEVLEAEATVLATGAWLPELSGAHGVRRPVQAGRGYSFSVDLGYRPEHAVYLPGANVVCTPIQDRLRVTGMMDLRKPAAPPAPRAISRIVQGAAPVFSGVDWTARTAQWCGARPLTPDGLPLVGRSGSPRVFVSGGHGMWGFTHGLATSRLIADLIVGNAVPDWLNTLAPTR